MADVDASLYQWSTTESSNKPTGATTIGTGLDDNLRQIQATTRAWLASKGADIASATTTDLGAVAGLAHDITGTTTITSFGTVAAGIWKILKFEGALTLTHNATSLILPGGENITTADGDVAVFISEGSGNWRCVSYFPVAINPAKMVSTDESQELTNKTLNASVGKGTWTASGTWTLPAVTLGGAITYGGVTLSNAVTGTGNMVLSASPTLTGTLSAAAITASGNVTGNGANGFIAQLSGGQQLRLYGSSSGTSHQWDIYLNSTNLRLSDNTGGGTFVVDTGATLGGNLSVTGTGTFTGSAATLTQSLSAGGTTTGANYWTISNTGGNLRLGVDNSTGVSLITGGTAYGGVVGTNNNTTLHLISNGTSIAQVTSTGVSVTGTLSSSGTLGVSAGAAVGGATPGTGGVAFPATAVAVADANTLDDYEEGTWTPVVRFGGASVGITYGNQTGRYTRIGHSVEWNCVVTLTSKGSSTGTADISGLPFTNLDVRAASTISQVDGVTITDYPNIFVDASATTIALQETTNAGTRTVLTDADFTNTSGFVLSGTYFA